MCNKNIILRFQPIIKNIIYYEKIIFILINKICFNKQLQNNEIK